MTAWETLMFQRRAKGGEPTHRFGGDWTETKLNVLSDYLAAYTTALKNKPFKKAFIDAFAGTGYRNVRHEDGDAESPLLFPDLAEESPQELLEGSARLALRTEPPFDSFVFIEKSEERCRALEDLKSEFPELAERITIHHEDANLAVQRLCRKNWTRHRAVLFLDPYGMQVEWETLKAIAGTGAIDLWLLFPLGIGVNRLLTRDGKIPASWRQRLNLLLGTENWYDEFYKVVEEEQGTLFGTPEARIQKSGVEAVGRFFVSRLKEIFPGVAERPGVLRNSRNCPLYLLCFAAANQKGAKTALRIARHLLKGLS